MSATRGYSHYSGASRGAPLHDDIGRLKRYMKAIARKNKTLDPVTVFYLATRKYIDKGRNEDTLPVPVWLEYLIAESKVTGRPLKIVFSTKDIKDPIVFESISKSVTTARHSKTGKNCLSYDGVSVRPVTFSTVQVPIDFNRVGASISDAGESSRSSTSSGSFLPKPVMVNADFSYKLSVMNDEREIEKKGIVAASSAIKKRSDSSAMIADQIENELGDYYFSSPAQLPSSSSSSSSSSPKITPSISHVQDVNTMYPKLPHGSTFSIASKLYDENEYEALRDNGMPASKLIFDAVSAGPSRPIRINKVNIISSFDLPERESGQVHGVVHSICNSAGIEGYVKSKGISADIGKDDVRSVVSTVYKEIKSALHGTHQMGADKASSSSSSSSSLLKHALAVGSMTNAGEDVVEQEMRHDEDALVYWGQITKLYTSVSILNMMKELGEEGELESDTYIYKLFGMHKSKLSRWESKYFSRVTSAKGSSAMKETKTTKKRDKGKSGDVTGHLVSKVLKSLYKRLYKNVREAKEAADMCGKPQMGPTIAQLLDRTSGLPRHFGNREKFEAEREEELLQTIDGISAPEVEKATDISRSPLSLWNMYDDSQATDTERAEYMFARDLRGEDVEMESVPGSWVSPKESLVEAALLSMIALRLSKKIGSAGLAVDDRFESAIVSGVGSYIDLKEELLWNPVLNRDGTAMVESEETSITSSTSGAFGSFDYLKDLVKSFPSVSHTAKGRVQDMIHAHKIRDSHSTKGSDYINFSSLGCSGTLVDKRYTIYYCQGGIHTANYAIVFWVPEMNMWGALNLITLMSDKQREEMLGRDPSTMSKKQAEKLAKSEMEWERSVVVKVLDSIRSGIEKAANRIALPRMESGQLPSIEHPKCHGMLERMKWKNEKKFVPKEKEQWFEFLNQKPMSSGALFGTRITDSFSGDNGSIQFDVSHAGSEGKTYVYGVSNSSASGSAQRSARPIATIVFDSESSRNRSPKKVYGSDQQSSHPRFLAYDSNSPRHSSVVGEKVRFYQKRVDLPSSSSSDSVGSLGVDAYSTPRYELIRKFNSDTGKRVAAVQIGSSLYYADPLDFKCAQHLKSMIAERMKKVTDFSDVVSRMIPKGSTEDKELLISSLLFSKPTSLANAKSVLPDEYYEDSPSSKEIGASLIGRNQRRSRAVIRGSRAGALRRRRAQPYRRVQPYRRTRSYGRGWGYRGGHWHGRRRGRGYGLPLALLTGLGLGLTTGGLVGGYTYHHGYPIVINDPYYPYLTRWGEY